MLLLNFYFLLIGFAMFNFSFCYDYILDYESDSFPVSDKFQRRSVDSKKNYHKKAEKVKSRNNLDKANRKQQKKDDRDILYLDVAKFLDPSDKYITNYESQRSITASDLDLRFQKPSKKVGKARTYERRLSRGNLHNDNEYYSRAMKNRLVKRKIKPSRSKHFGSFNEISGAARLGLKRDTSLKTSFGHSKNKSSRLPQVKSRSKKERRFSVFRKSKKQNKNNNKTKATNKKVNDNAKDKKLNTKPIAPNKDLSTTKLEPAKESKPIKQIHVCPLCKREIDYVQSERGKKVSNGVKVHRVKSIQRRKVSNISPVTTRRRRTRKRLFKNANMCM